MKTHDALRARRDRFGDILVIELRGPLDAFVRDPLVGAVSEHLGDGVRHVVLDLRHVRFLSSSAVAGMLACRRLCRDAGGDLVLARPSRVARETLELLGVDGLLAIRDDRLAAVSRRPALRDPRGGPTRSSRR